MGLRAIPDNLHPFVAAARFLRLCGLLPADARLWLRVSTALFALLGVNHRWWNGTTMGLSETAAVALVELVLPRLSRLGLRLRS